MLLLFNLNFPYGYNNMFYVWVVSDKHNLPVLLLLLLASRNFRGAGIINMDIKVRCKIFYMVTSKYFDDIFRSGFSGPTRSIEKNYFDFIFF